MLAGKYPGCPSDAGVRCGVVQRPFLLHRAPNCGASSVHAPNRAPHRPALVWSGAEGFGARCTRFVLESLTRRDASDAQLFDMLVEESQQALSICDM